MTLQTAAIQDLSLARGASRLGGTGILRRVRETLSTYQRERDLDRIVDSLSRLNARQLRALGLTPETLYSYAAERVDALHDRIGADEAEGGERQLALTERKEA